MAIAAIYPASSGGGGGGSGTVTSVNVSGGTTGLTFTGGPITTSGTITAGGVLGVPNGGTGDSTFTANGVLYGNGTSPLQVTAAGTAGQVLTAGVGGVPGWATGGSGTVRKAATNWPNASGTSFSFAHGLGTTDINVTVIDLSTNQIIGVDTITVTDANDIALTSSEAPATNWRVVVMG